MSSASLFRMPAETPSADRLLRFARELQRATDYDGLVRTTQREIEEVTGSFRLHLVGRGPLTDDQRADVEGLTVTADHMAALVRQLLTLGRPQPETLEVVDLHARLRELVQLVGRGTPPGTRW